jgi:hypothetical protein
VLSAAVGLATGEFFHDPLGIPVPRWATVLAVGENSKPEEGDEQGKESASVSCFLSSHDSLFLPSIDQARQHPGDLFQSRLELFVRRGLQQLSSQCQFQQRDTFLHRASGDAEKVLSVRFGEAAIAFSNIRSNRHRRAIQLVDEKAIAPGKLLGASTDLVGEINRLLIDEEFFERERHSAQGRAWR